MRICHVSPHLPPDQAANALLPAQLADWARQQGHDPRLVAHEPAQGRAASDSADSHIWRIPRKRRTSGVSRLLRIESLKQARQIRAALTEAAAGADVLHLHSNGLIIEVAAAWASARGLPYVLTLYGTEIWHYQPRRPVDPFARAFRRARAVTFYSRKLMERGTELGLSHPAGSVIYPAIAAAFGSHDRQTRDACRAELGIREPHVLLNVKRLHELAGQQYLIDAFASVARARTDTRLVICGTGPLRESLEKRASDRGINDRVTFTGLVSNELVARYAAVADLFVLPSLLEALPTVAVEALASGTPVISADHPGGVELHEIFGDDVRVVPKANSDLLADALSHALSHPRRASNETLQRVRAHFGLDSVTTQYQRLYTEL